MTGRCIAMWSGPRNISTAMMRAWENRADTTVVDEPFYAYYLKTTGIDHPMREEIIASGETNWQVVAQTMASKPSTGIFYQKHIATHWFDHFAAPWLDALDHVFLIREPEPVIASYTIKRGSLNTADLGYEQQAHLFDLLYQQRGKHCIVIDSGRFLANPEAQLRTVCEHLAIEFDPNMLSWPSGARQSDGVWGVHWYDAVNHSTGFAPPREFKLKLDKNQQKIAQACRAHYEKLRAFAI